MPALPDPPPMAAFRGEPLTHEIAEALFIGCGALQYYSHMCTRSITCLLLLPRLKATSLGHWPPLCSTLQLQKYAHNGVLCVRPDSQDFSSCWQGPA